MKEEPASSSDSWFVYILRCADGSLYTGITKDFLRRFVQHNSGTVSRYTRSRLPVVLKFQEAQVSQSAALKTRTGYQGTDTEKKENLIESVKNEK